MQGGQINFRVILKSLSRGRQTLEVARARWIDRSNRPLEGASAPGSPRSDSQPSERARGLRREEARAGRRRDSLGYASASCSG